MFLLRGLPVLLLPAAASAHLLITEVTVTPTDGEFVEIFNPSDSSVDLSDYYITDAIYANDSEPDYVNVVDGSYTPYDSDFLARFPTGATIGARSTIVVANNGAGFETTYGTSADFELLDTGATTDMGDPGGDWIGGNPTLSNSGEVAILFHWDGMSDLVADVDIALWGDAAEAVDKTGVSKDGPDGDSDATAYDDDTAVESQAVISSAAHEYGESYQRSDCAEMGETSVGGNGVDGHDETSEDLSHWTEGLPTPGVPPQSADCGTVGIQSISWGALKARFITE